MNAIMYHYVRPKNYSKFKKIKYLDFDLFKRQLDYFEKKFGILTTDEFVNNYNKKINTDKVVLTFDDGLKDHYNFVFPELKKRKINAFFFICNDQYKSNDVLPVHKIHHLISEFNSQTLLKKALKIISTNDLDNKLINEFDKEIYKNQINNDYDFQFKRLFNYYLKYDKVNLILNELSLDLFDFQELSNILYLKLSELIEMENDGNIIGGHTVSHKVLSRLDKEDQFYEIKSNLDFLMNNLKMITKSFCYPYGGKNSYNNNTIEILNDLSFHHAFAVNDTEINNHNFNFKFELNRIDCNKFLNI